MSIVAAFYWKKSSQSIATVIFDREDFRILSKPRISFCSNNFFSFRKQVKQVTQSFFNEIKTLHNESGKSIQIEFKIVFYARHIPYLKPSPESKYVYQTFSSMVKKTKKTIKHLKVNPQLRKKLSGRSLKYFNREIRKLNLVSGKANKRYEYNLWAVALHVTSGNYKTKIKQVRATFVNLFWEGRLS